MVCDWGFALTAITTILFLLSILTLIFPKRSSSKNNLPPGPAGWPVFGHMFSLGSIPHQTTARLKHNYGPVVMLKIGSINTMVVLTPKAAADFFKNHDLAFADRKIVETMRVHSYNEGSLALAPYGTYWRLLRRIGTTEMFTNKRIKETATIRRKCIDDMLSWIRKEANNRGEGNGIDVMRFVFLASFNMLGNLMLSRDLVDPDSKKASEFYDAMMGVMEWSSHPNLSDIFPCLRWLDLQGLRRKASRDFGKAIEIASAYVKERIEGGKNGGQKRKDFLDVLLEFEGIGKEEPDKLSEHGINIFILEMFFAGSETTSSTVEWALTELLRHPEAMLKAQSEIAKVIGPKRKLEEFNIENLSYLQAVVKETLRLHPSIPFLIPRSTIQDTTYMGYHVPKNTQVFVNVWAIGRDSEYWDDPSSFKPERFLSSNIEFKGQNFEYLPFGAGRRICIGMPLANRMVQFVLGSLIHEFDLKLESSVSPDSIDMSERIGSTVRKLVPLKVVPVPRKRVD